MAAVDRGDRAANLLARSESLRALGHAQTQDRGHSPGQDASAAIRPRRSRRCGRAARGRVSAGGVSGCECGWKLPCIQMECKLQLGGGPEIVDAIKLASVAIETLVELGGALDVLSIAHVECPNC